MNNTNQQNERSDKDNYNFIQLNRAHMKQWRGLIRSNPIGAEILYFLMEHMGKTNNAVICSYKTLQAMTGYSRSPVASAIKKLKEDNWIQSVKVGSATAYAVNERVAWQKGRDQRKYAIFSATVIAGEAEQDSDFHEEPKEELKNIPIVEASQKH